MISFRNDYSETAHAAVLKAISRLDGISSPGYSEDDYCRQAADEIRSRFSCPHADVHFLVGGTIANTTVIAAFLRPWEAVIAASTAHINVHETGAVESAGHKVIDVPTSDGKLTPDHIRQVMESHQDGNEEHMVLPRMVYISNATELGTIYTREELEALRAVCDENGLYLYLDGARLAPALAAAGNDLTAADFPRLCDCFYIGGTKNGLLFGEAVVISNPSLQPYFRNMIKQRGGMLAKGFLFGVQFSAFLKDDLWMRLAENSVRQAQKLSAGFLQKGYPLYAQSPTNQVFCILPDETIARLQKDFTFEFTCRTDETHCAMRFVCSWATTDEDVSALLDAL